LLNAQFAGVVASPLTGLVRGLGSMIQGLALQLGQIAEQGLVSGEAPAAAPAPAEEKPAETEAPAEAEASAAEPEAGDAPAEEPKAEAESPAEEAPEANAADDETSEKDSKEEEG